MVVLNVFLECRNHSCQGTGLYCYDHANCNVDCYNNDIQWSCHENNQYCNCNFECKENSNLTNFGNTISSFNSECSNSTKTSKTVEIAIIVSLIVVMFIAVVIIIVVRKKFIQNNSQESTTDDLQYNLLDENDKSKF